MPVVKVEPTDDYIDETEEGRHGDRCRARSITVITRDGFANRNSIHVTQQSKSPSRVGM